MNLHLVSALGLAAIGFCTPTLLAQEPAPIEPSQSKESAPATAILGVHVVDVESGRLLRDQSLLLERGRIVAIRPANRFEPPEDAAIVAGEGLYALPGLFDSHVHLLQADRQAKLMLANGVVAMRHLGGQRYASLQFRESFASGRMLGPRMFTVGPILDGKPPVWPFSIVCDTPEQGRQAVRDLIEDGVDQIKVYSRLKPEVYRAILAECHAQGIPATGHIPNRMTVEDALEAGQACVEHMTGFEHLIGDLLEEPPPQTGGPIPAFGNWKALPQVDRAALQAKMRSIDLQRLWQCPTLIVMKSIGRVGHSENEAEAMPEFVAPFERQFWDSYSNFAPHAREALPHLIAMVGELHRAGVPLLVGTDLANPYVIAGFAVHQEMALFQEAGIPPADILRSASLLPARFLGVETELGSIAPGKEASLLLCRSNPLEDVRHAAQIEHVFLRGRGFDRAALDALLDECRIGEPAPAGADEEEGS